jgi:hypothetical protein
MCHNVAGLTQPSTQVVGCTKQYVKGTLLLDHEVLSHPPDQPPQDAETQLSLLNDEDLADFGLLLIQAPYCWRIHGITLIGHRTHQQPTTKNTGGRSGA